MRSHIPHALDPPDPGHHRSRRDAEQLHGRVQWPADGETEDTLARPPFRSYLVPGMVLFAVVGGVG
jgi:hypothetical protein